jgi:hypothetical protein
MMTIALGLSLSATCSGSTGVLPLHDVSEPSRTSSLSPSGSNAHTGITLGGHFGGTGQLESPSRQLT